MQVFRKMSFSGILGLIRQAMTEGLRTSSCHLCKKSQLVSAEPKALCLQSPLLIIAYFHTNPGPCTREFSVATGVDWGCLHNSSCSCNFPTTSEISVCTYSASSRSGCSGWGDWGGCGGGGGGDGSGGGGGGDEY